MYGSFSPQVLKVNTCSRGMGSVQPALKYGPEMKLKGDLLSDFIDDRSWTQQERVLHAGWLFIWRVNRLSGVLMSWGCSFLTQTPTVRQVFTDGSTHWLWRCRWFWSCRAPGWCSWRGKIHSPSPPLGKTLKKQHAHFPHFWHNKHLFSSNCSFPLAVVSSHRPWNSAPGAPPALGATWGGADVWVSVFRDAHLLHTRWRALLPGSRCRTS